MQNLKQMSDKSGGAPLAARIGVATGRVIIHQKAGDHYGENVVGACLNKAARLQTLASENTAIVCAATRQLVGKAFEFEDLGAQSLKGFERPESVYAIKPRRRKGPQPVRGVARRTAHAAGRPRRRAGGAAHHDGAGLRRRGRRGRPGRRTRHRQVAADRCAAPGRSAWQRALSVAAMLARAPVLVVAAGQGLSRLGIRRECRRSAGGAPRQAAPAVPIGLADQRGADRRPDGRGGVERPGPGSQCRYRHPPEAPHGVPDPVAEGVQHGDAGPSAVPGLRGRALDRPDLGRVPGKPGQERAQPCLRGAGDHPAGRTVRRSAERARQGVAAGASERRASDRTGEGGRPDHRARRQDAAGHRREIRRRAAVPRGIRADAERECRRPPRRGRALSCAAFR